MEKKAKATKKMSNKLFAGIWGGVLAILLVALIVANCVALQYATIITRSLGHNTVETVNVDTSGASDYFTSDYSSQEDLLAHEVAISQQIEAEGAVLLKNDQNALPMTEGSKVTFLSLASTKFRYGGGGSGAIDETNVQSLKEAFEAEGFEVNPTVWEMYQACEERLPYEIAPSDFSQAVVDSCSSYNDAAIFVFSRPGHEASDLTEEEVSLTDDEAAVLEFANQNFSKIIVLVNAANAIELGWMADYSNIQAALWVGYPGQEGLAAVPQILKGSVNPSGKLVDTYAYSAESSAAYQNFGYGQVENGYNDVGAKNTYVVYGEGIYVGYRYYETRYEDTVLQQGNAAGTAGSIDGGAWDYTKEVLYPFGYGLSYTDFTYSNFQFTEEEDHFTASVTVTNSGTVAGANVVEFYFQSPYTDYDKANLVEKASVELCGFARTDVLEPGSSVTVETEIDKETLRAYDAKNAKTYIVDAGTYYFTVGADVHQALNNILAAKGYTTADGMDANGQADMTATYEQATLDTTTYAVDSVTGTAITNQFDYSSMTYYDDSYVYLTRSDWVGTWPSFYGEMGKRNYTITASDELLADSQENHYADDPDAVMPTTGSGEGLKLITMRGKDYDDEGWDAILDCLTVEEMMDMVRLGGWQTAMLTSVSKPVSNDQDGPAGISDNLIASNTNCMGYPIQVVLASTWDVDLIEEMGKCVGEDGLAAGIQGWYAPGAGTHRTPYGGRNFEYYSEDGYLAGKICAAEVRGCQSKGMYVYLKHMVLNDQEERRYGIATFATEQALRELYLTPFEYAVKEADAHGIMAAFNGIGGIWCGANTDLLTDVLRGEWGFHGIVVTDYATANTGYMWIDMGLQAGADLWLNSDSTVYQIENVESNPTLVTALRNASHNILYTVVNSAAMNGFNEETEIRQTLPLWQIWQICLDVAVVVIEVVGILLIVRRCKKNRQTA
jgi:beta-glucosidase